MVSREKDYYKILGVSKDATLDEIKKAYRKLARKFHPDVNSGNKQAEAKFKEISEAYAVLSNEDKRRQYDQFGFSRDLFDGFDFDSAFSDFGFGDVFDMFFGTNFGRQKAKRSRRGSDVSTDIEISFEEAAFGVEKEITYFVDDICEKCNGSGSKDDGGVATCSVCGGTGQIRATRQTFIGNIVTTSTCRNCEGTGEVIKNFCNKCKGSGYYRKKKNIIINFPGGISNGDSLRVNGKGNSRGKDSIRGDLFVIVRVKPHPEFKRDGDNVISKIDISFAQASLGTRFELNTLDGKEEIIVKPGTQPGSRVILRSKGIKKLDGYGRGDHIINVNVRIPDRLSKEEINLLRKYAEGREEIVGNGSYDFFKRMKSTFRR